MTNISVAIATYNEENTIKTCLDSVAHWCTEIIMVDGESTDRTVAIAKKFGVKVYSAPNQPMFHKNKQMAIDRCTGDWILQLDADEVVPKELAEEIKKTLRKKTDINGYYFPRKNLFLGRYLTKGGQYPDYNLRLYKKGKGKLPCKSVHEQAIVTGKTGYLVTALLHNSYPDFSHYLSHFNRYTSIFADELVEEKETVTFISGLKYIFITPVCWFLLTYLRHRGYVDGFTGFVFSFFSALRFPVAYVKYLCKKIKK
jgi:glycosyltransferase involved in cell wall biosynthesis